MRSKLAAYAALAAFSVSLAGTALAQEAYPTKPITYIVPFAPGGSSDISARLIAAKLSEELGQPVLVENRGGGGAVGVVAMARARPDGYTIGHLSSGAYSISPHFGVAQYDVFKDFTPLAYMMNTYTGLIFSKSFAPNSLPELIEFARKNPGKVTFASSGTGGYSHLLGEALKVSAGIDIVHVPYSGSSAAMTDLLAGRVNMLFDSAPVERVTSGQAKGIAAMSPTRIKQLPDMPTVFEALPNFPVGDSGWGVVGPAGLPPAIVKRLSDALLKIAADPDFIAKAEGRGYGVDGRSPADFAALMRKEYEQYGEIIRKAGIKDAR